MQCRVDLVRMEGEQEMEGQSGIETRAEKGNWPGALARQRPPPGILCLCLVTAMSQIPFSFLSWEF